MSDKPPLELNLPCDDETPVSLFARWRHERYAFLFESREGGEKWGRYSFIGLDPSLVVSIQGNLATVEEGKRKRTVPTSDPLGLLRQLIGAPRNGAERFAGGLVGFVSYDAVRFFEKNLIKKEANRVPDFYFIRPRVLLIYDNLKHSLRLIGDGEGARKSIRKVLARLKRRPVLPSPQEGRKLKWGENFSWPKFEKRVRKVKEYILAGDVTQAVLSRRWEAKGKRDPFQVYRRLRFLNPSPYLFYLKLNHLQLVGASPETMVHLEGRVATLRPIAGTRPRGRDEDEDKRLETELLNDAKERAEHIMLVDLGRNDLGRIAKAGSVRVKELMKVERYSHVMHLVTTLQAELGEGLDGFDLLKAAFPAGTLSGSPKIRAMQIIDELEPTRRGTYGGCVGYFSENGNMDMAITIRSALFEKDRIVVQAGAGIVADSDPRREYEECGSKAKAVMMAIEGM